MPQLQKELRQLLEPRFAPRANYKRQDPNNKKFDFILKNEPVPLGVAMSDLSNSTGTKKFTSKSCETILLKFITRYKNFVLQLNTGTGTFVNAKAPCSSLS
jgi:hypothetical protein